MATPRSIAKGKRTLPNIPHFAAGVKHGVNFNCETIETSIGGTHSHGRLKADPLSPMNRLSSDETSLRSENAISSSLEESVCEQNCKDVDSLAQVQTRVHNGEANTSVSVEVSVNRDAAKSESDKENDPNNHRASNGVAVDCTPIRGQYHMSRNGVDEIASLQIYSPSPNMKVRHATPIRRHTLDEKMFGTPECYTVVQLDKNRYDFGFSEFLTDAGEDSCSVTVAVRVRPFSQRYRYMHIDRATN